MNMKMIALCKKLKVSLNALSIAAEGAGVDVVKDVNYRLTEEEVSKISDEINTYYFYYSCF